MIVFHIQAHNAKQLNCVPEQDPNVGNSCITAELSMATVERYHNTIPGSRSSTHMVPIHSRHVTPY